MRRDALMLSPNIASLLLLLLLLLLLRGCFPRRMWDEKSAVRSHPSRLPLAFSPGPRCSPINTDSIIMRPTSHSRCGRSAEQGGKAEEERSKVRGPSGRWSRERMKAGDKRRRGSWPRPSVASSCREAAPHAAGKISQPVNAGNSLRQGSNMEIN